MSAKEERRGTANRGVGPSDVDVELREELEKQAQRRRGHATLLDREEIAAEIAESRRRADAVLAAERPVLSNEVPTVRPPATSFEEMALDSLPAVPVLTGGKDRGSPRAPTPPTRFAIPPPAVARAAATEPESEQRRPRSTAAPRSSESIDLTDAWNRVYRDRAPTPPRTTREEWEKSYRQLRALGQVSLSGVQRVARSTSVQSLRDRGFPIPESLTAEMLDELITSIVYVGPGFGAFLTPAGELLADSPVGYSFAAAGVSTPQGRQVSGLFLGGRDYFVQLAQGQIGAIQQGRFGVAVETGWEKREKLEEWSARTTGQLFVISPSYWDRKSVGSAVQGGPERLWDAVSLCVRAGYLEAAIRDTVKSLTSMDLWDVAKTAFTMLVGKLVPLPLPSDVEEKQRQGIAIGMAIWGRSNAQADLDIAARLLAPEIAPIAIAKAKRAVKRVAGFDASAAPPAVPPKPPSASGMKTGSHRASGPDVPPLGTGVRETPRVIRERVRGTQNRVGAETAGQAASGAGTAEASVAGDVKVRQLHGLQSTAYEPTPNVTPGTLEGLQKAPVTDDVKVRRMRGLQPTAEKPTGHVTPGTLEGLEEAPKSGPAPKWYPTREESLHNVPSRDKYGKTNLRRSTPTAKIRRRAQQQLTVGSPDPALPGRVVDGLAEPDHIVSVARIRNMPGFGELDERTRRQVVNWPRNFEPLSPFANHSKNARGFSEWRKALRARGEPINEAYFEKMIELEARLAAELQGPDQRAAPRSVEVSRIVNPARDGPDIQLHSAEQVSDCDLHGESDRHPSTSVQRPFQGGGYG